MADQDNANAAPTPAPSPAPAGSSPPSPPAGSPAGSPGEPTAAAPVAASEAPKTLSSKQIIAWAVVSVVVVAGCIYAIANKKKPGSSESAPTATNVPGGKAWEAVAKVDDPASVEGWRKSIDKTVGDALTANAKLKAENEKLAASLKAREEQSAAMFATIRSELSRGGGQSGAAVNATISGFSGFGVARASDDEVNAVPSYLRSTIKETAAFLDNMALSDGKILVEQVRSQVDAHVKSLMPAGFTAPSTWPEDVGVLTQVARVRAEPLNERLINEVPGLAARRDLGGLGQSDLAAIAQLVTAQRTAMPPYTAGQLLSLVQQVATVPAGRFASLAAEVAVGGQQVIAEIDVGPVAVSRGNLARLVLLRAIELCDRDGLSPLSADGAALVVLVAEQRERIIADAFRVRDASDVVLNPTEVAEKIDMAIARLRPAAQRIAGLMPIPGTQVGGPVGGVAPERAPGGSWAALNAAVAASLVGGIAHDQATFASRSTAALAEAAKTSVPQVLGWYAGSGRQKATDRAYSWEALLAVRDGVHGNDGTERLAPALGDALRASKAVAAGADGAMDSTYPSDFRERMVVRIPLLSHASAVGLVPARNDQVEVKPAAVAAAAARLIAVPLAAYYADREARERLVPLYRGYDSDQGVWTPILTALPADAERAATVIVQRRGPTFTVDRIAVLAQQIAKDSMDQVEASVVRRLLAARIHRRLLESGILASEEAIAQADQHARTRVAILARMPYTSTRLTRVEEVVLRECQDVLAGRRRAATAATAALDARAAQRPGSELTQGSSGASSAAKPASAVTFVTESGADQGVPMVGTTRHRAASRVVVIPALAYGSAHLLHGITVPLGGQRPVRISLDWRWEGPHGSHLTLHNMLIGGVATPNPPDRVDIQITKISYDFKNGFHWDADVDGYVTDATNTGMGGVPANWDIHGTTLFPLLMIAGGGEAFRDSLYLASRQQSGTNVTIVNSTGTSVGQPVQDTSTLAKQAGLAAAGGAAGGLAKMAEQLASQVPPCLIVNGGQAIVVTLNKTVAIMAPEEAWASEESNTPVVGGF